MFLSMLEAHYSTIMIIVIDKLTNCFAVMRMSIDILVVTLLNLRKWIMAWHYYSCHNNQYYMLNVIVT